ncbi:MAG: FAD-dependent oxidoreductase [Bacteroidota bacterium]|nr:FAD-dependent oxidoreductase [Bacteroidota bacterium]
MSYTPQVIGGSNCTSTAYFYKACNFPFALQRNAGAMDIIVLGAGAAGLMAAKKLLGAGLNVCILEARNRLGGRIQTFSIDAVDGYEGGAEFIHGDLEATMQILAEAGLEKHPLTGETWQVANGKWSQENEFFAYANEVTEKLKLVEDDISIATFINKYFADEKYETLRKSLTSYIEGYYSGEIAMTSAKAFLQEWQSEDDQQYRPAGGYGKMIQYLRDSCAKAGADIKLETVVKTIRWTKGEVEVIDEIGHRYTAKRVIITVPLGVWTAEEHAKGAIQFIPELPAKKEAAKQMGFGAVIKVLLKFEENFYYDELLNRSGKHLSTLHMAITDNPIPTWWTQYPAPSTLLTGWLSGPKAAEIKDHDDTIILAESLRSLQKMFGINKHRLQEKLQWFKIFNWTIDPYTRGSYSYSTLDTYVARRLLAEPCEDTLFFAGEALYDGPEMGTVEAALTSGAEVAAAILAGSKAL